MINLDDPVGASSEVPCQAAIRKEASDLVNAFSCLVDVTIAGAASHGADTAVGKCRNELVVPVSPHVRVVVQESDDVSGRVKEGLVSRSSHVTGAAWKRNAPDPRKRR